MDGQRNAKQRAVGTLLGLLLVRVVLPWLLGPVGMIWFALIVFGLTLVALGQIARGKWRMRRLRRTSCDRQLIYARRQRQAAGDPDFGNDDVQAIRRARARGDFEAVHAIIASANKRLWDQKLVASRATAAKARARDEAERRRPDELRLYRA